MHWLAGERRTMQVLVQEEDLELAKQRQLLLS